METQKSFLLHKCFTSPTPSLQVKRGLRKKGEPLGLSRPWRVYSAPFRSCQRGLEGGATWSEPQLPGKIAGRFRGDSELSLPGCPHLRVPSHFPGWKAGPERATGFLPSVGPGLAASPLAAPSTGWARSPGRSQPPSPAAAARAESRPVLPPGALPRGVDKGIPPRPANTPFQDPTPLHPPPPAGLGASPRGRIPGPFLFLRISHTHCDIF